MIDSMAHAPPNYKCPFCAFLEGKIDKDTLLTKDDIVYETDLVMAFLSVKWWPNNPGHVLVIPKEHIENIYTISDELLAEIYRVTKIIAIAMKIAYNCDGISTRQHNESAGNQDVWHFHKHIFPRWENDHLYGSFGTFVSAQERRPYSEKLKKALENCK
jgi:histidine triad (HIT) family protein